MHTLNVRITHKKADVPTLESISFTDPKEALRDIAALPQIKGCVLIQTCNRVEIFVAAENISEAHHNLIDYIMGETIAKFKAHFKNGASKMPREKILEHMITASKQFHDVIEVEYHNNALLHLLRLACGMESMIIGEDQILGQMKESLAMARESRCTNPFLTTIFTKSIKVGQRARKETRINEGAVSIGSAAVDLAKEVFGDLSDRKVLITGAGDMGKLITKSLTEVETREIVVANRTFEKAAVLAESLGGRAVKFEDIQSELADTDLLLTATGATKPIITVELVKPILDERKSGEALVVIDVANPRDVEPAVGMLDGVTLFNIDSLRSVANENLKKRMKEVYAVEEIIEEEIGLLEKKLYHVDVDRIVTAVFKNAETVRTKELEKAISMLGNGIGEKEKEVIDRLTKVIVKRTMTPITKQIRRVAEIDDKDALRAAEIYFLRGES
ncbi:glutamyl-tRNA reductase [archaeon BMS3Bbin16]|nr:glutamyl-tRNA reductase [archaeon BMS3Bbin16]